MKGADAKASKCHLKYSSKISIFLRLLFMLALEEHFNQHVKAFASEPVKLYHASMILGF